jgi:hypothetical protein
MSIILATTEAEGQKLGQKLGRLCLKNKQQQQKKCKQKGWENGSALA